MAQVAQIDGVDADLMMPELVPDRLRHHTERCLGHVCVNVLAGALAQGLEHALPRGDVDDVGRRIALHDAGALEYENEPRDRIDCEGELIEFSCPRIDVGSGCRRQRTVKRGKLVLVGPDESHFAGQKPIALCVGDRDGLSGVIYEDVEAPFS
jgi:hypothetical protein